MVAIRSIISIIKSRSERAINTFMALFGGMFIVLPWVDMVYPIIKQNPICLTMHIVGILCITMLTIFAGVMPRRTPYGNEMLGRIRGFKRFLETAEKDQLEKLVEENPEYFYNILPYTYALGISNKWIEQFETIAMKEPDWYDNNSPFDMHDFNHFMNNTMSSVKDAMSSTPSSSGGSSGGSSSSGSSSGGGSSGGGSSGGGSGGGGGGSW